MLSATADLSRDERTLVEQGYRGGAISVCCATSTLAAGVNMPVRRVIFRWSIVIALGTTVAWQTLHWTCLSRILRSLDRTSHVLWAACLPRPLCTVTSLGRPL